jgi:hypothetical protein
LTKSSKNGRKCGNYGKRLSCFNVEIACSNDKHNMKKILLLIAFVLVSVASISAQATTEKNLLELSKKKWAWMSDKNTDSLQVLFNDKSNFVHMGGTWGKSREIDIIKNGFIWYKKAEIYTASVNIFGNTAILLNDIDLVAVVGGKEVINPFMVTEVYLKESGRWNLLQLTFSHLARPVILGK